MNSDPIGGMARQKMSVANEMEDGLQTGDFRQRPRSSKSELASSLEHVAAAEVDWRQYPRICLCSYNLSLWG